MDIRTIVITAVGISVLLLLTLCIILKRRRLRTDIFQDMAGDEFESYCALLLKNNGYTDVEVTQTSRDYGVDVFAYKDGVSYAIQCKCYSDTVGIKAVQEIYAGRDYYDRMVGVVMTNQYFSKPAMEVAQKLNILLWDGDYLSEMVSIGR